MPTLTDLKSRFALIDGLQQAGTSLSWDQDTQMPRGGAASRARAMGAVSRVVHDLSTDSTFLALLEAAEAEALPLNALVARIDAERIQAAAPPNLASAIRVWLFERAPR